MRSSTFECSSFFDHPVETVFPFFADACNLAAITPPWLRFRILSPMPVEMRAGATIEYRLRWRGIPLGWRTLITEWSPPHGFVDEQVRGPYRLWRHEHRFEAVPGGTRMRDRVTWSTWGGWVTARFVVGPDIARIFAYRSRVLDELAQTW